MERNGQEPQPFIPFESPVISPVCLCLALSRTFSLSSLSLDTWHHLIHGFDLKASGVCAFPTTKILEVDFQYVQVILANWGEGTIQGEKNVNISVNYTSTISASGYRPLSAFLKHFSYNYLNVKLVKKSWKATQNAGLKPDLCPLGNLESNRKCYSTIRTLLVRDLIN